jgi:hypothetical protein
MTKSPRKSAGDAQLPLLPDDQAVLAALRRRADALSAATQRIMQDLDKGGSFARSKEALAALRNELQELKSLGDELDVLETKWSERAEREFLEMEAAVREALRSRGWQIEGQWPKLYVERAIAVEFDDRSRSFKVADRTIPKAAAADIIPALEPLVSDLIPRNFSEARFMQSLADAYDDLQDGKSSQIPLLKVYRQLVLRLQKPNFWRDARADAFIGMSMEQFRARLSRALVNDATRVAGPRELRLLPPIDPKQAVYLYQPAEGRFGFVGRIEFVSTKTSDA